MSVVLICIYACRFICIHICAYIHVRIYIQAEVYRTCLNDRGVHIYSYVDIHIYVFLPTYMCVDIYRQRYAEPVQMTVLLFCLPL